MSIINGRSVGGGAPLKSLTIIDENGEEVLAVVVDKEAIFDATAEDVKLGKTFASHMGVETGVDTRTSRVLQGTCLIHPGESFSVPLSEYDAYDYTGFQAMIAVFNTTELDSVAVEKIALHDAVYVANSGNKVSDITKNDITKSVDFNFTNDTANVYVIHFSTYKED